jgi:hypothetical protein
MMRRMPLIEVDHGFEPWKVQILKHHLVKHPLLQLDALVELGKRQEQRRLVRTHNDQATAGSSFADAPKQHPNPKNAATTLAGIAEAKAWMSLLNVQCDPLYRTLIDEVLDSVKPVVDARDPGMCYRAGWIFVTSPGAVTPFHMDHEHNFIMQISGAKQLYTWDPFDREVFPEEGLELFHDHNSREKAVWKDSFRERATIIDLEPGVGGYMPSTTPHMVINGNEPSITISFTYYTNSTRRRELLYRANAHLRRMSISPTPVGRSKVRDEIKHSILSAYTGTRSLVRRALGRGVRVNGLPYAPVS